MKQIHTRRLLGALILAGAGLVTGCATEGGGDSSGSGGTAEPSAPVTPDVVDLAALTERLAPAGEEKALLVNFWATW